MKFLSSLLAGLLLSVGVAHADPLQGRRQVQSSATAVTDGDVVVFDGTSGRRVKSGGAGSGVPTSRTVSTTSPLGGGGALSGDLTLTCTTCVTATSAFGTDNVVVRSDGTGRGAQLTGVTIDDSDRIGFGTAAPTHTVTHASTSTGTAIYNTSDQVTNYERALTSWVSNVYTIDVQQGGSGTQRTLQLKAGTSTITFTGNGTSGGGIQIVGVGSGTEANTSSIRASGNATMRVRSTVSSSQTIPGVSLCGTATQYSAAAGTQVCAVVDPDINQSSTAGYKALRVNVTETATGSGQKDLLSLEVGSAHRFRVDNAGTPDHDSTITTAGTTGNVTINKPCGTANIAAAGTAVTVTNSLVTASTFMSVLPRTNDSTCRVANYVPGSGTVTINMTAACNAETSIGFCIVDKN